MGNVLHASNPTTAASLIASFELALKAGKKLPLSFYKTLESPSVALYQIRATGRGHRLVRAGRA